MSVGNRWRRSLFASRHLRAAPGLAPAPASDVRAFSELMLEPASWVVRRVESISYLDTGETRRAISLDFALPAEYAVRDNPGTVLVPLALLAKRPLTRLDVRDDTGRAVPVLDTEANARWTSLAALSYARGQFELSERQQQQIVDLIRAPEVQGERISSELWQELAGPDEGRALTLAQDSALALLDDLASRFVLIAELPASVVGHRVVVKFAYEEPPGQRTAQWWRRFAAATKVQIDSPAVLDAASYHLELRPPAGVSASQLAITRRSVEEKRWRTGAQGPVAHLNVRDDDPGASYMAEAELRPIRSGLVAYAAVASLLVAALMAVPVLMPVKVALKVDDPGVGGALATALLVVPAFLLALLSRPLEHPVASQVYLPVRLTTAGTALVLLLAAATLVLGPVQYLLWRTAGVLLCVQTVLMGYAVYLLVQSDPRHTLRKQQRP